MSASRTIIDVPTILDPSSGGKKRRRDEDSEAAEDATDARSMAQLISTVLSGPHPAPVAPERQAGGADGSGGTGASVSKDAADKNGEEKSAADKAGLADEKETNDDSTTKPDRKAELRAQIEAAKAEMRRSMPVGGTFLVPMPISVRCTTTV